VTRRLSGVWQDALCMVKSGWSVIPLRERDKRPIWDEWPSKGVATPDGIYKLAVEYPSVRLPSEFKALIGKKASIYISEDIDKLTFNVVIDKKIDKVCANSERIHDENRLTAVESQIAELKSLILENVKLLQNISKKGAPESGFEPESEPRQYLFEIVVGKAIQNCQIHGYKF